MSAGVTAYVVIVSVYLLSYLLFGSIPPTGVLIAIAGVVGVCGASYLGFMPRTVSSYAAWFLRLPQDLYYDLMSKRPFNFNRVAKTVVVGRVPRTTDDIQTLIQQEQVRAVIDMTEPWEQRVETDAITRMGLERINLPTPDYGAPTFEDLNTAIDFIRRHAQLNNTVYVHCNGGKGRAATVAAAWLMYRESIAPQDALKLLRTKRKVTKLDRLGGILPVWKLLHRFHAAILDSKARL
ncbi:hypothetical protein PTSG_08529 [Salpingoeca rosetta]|uniref:Uncharacterized protein n=1 Tax=Salpingoeca rosetta (strain ATCC 50818 / BSB-021) TaxID=946362 RepID=F2UJY3_SALR5|nr:uncharacterized protein PTSG_08529 [Salpingoeca rosetta]EGD77432.1 hypothetical protein PTSG_08529 [Salpingoeca rosetta]|eukprot:XP_004990320.1 hypothetical protein PTSG_08529 [Salpingoeca rosetta]